MKTKEKQGPDELPTEFIKGMDEEHERRVLELLSTWWREENIKEEDLTARVVPICKK